MNSEKEFANFLEGKGGSIADARATVATGPQKGRRARILWSTQTLAGKLKDGQAFRMRSGGVYRVAKAGNFVRLDKDRRPVRLRKKMRRIARYIRANQQAYA